MTAEAYAAAEGLVERSAAAYVAGVPEYPADDGYFGPASVTWRLAVDMGRPVAGLSVAGRSPSRLPVTAIGSEAGNDSAPASSSPAGGGPAGAYWPSTARNAWGA